MRRIFSRHVGQVCCLWNHDLQPKNCFKNVYLQCFNLPKTGSVENMVAGQFFGRRCHLFAANDTNVIGSQQFFRSSVRIQSVHVVDGSSRQNHIAKCLLEVPNRVVHGPERKQRQRVNSHLQNSDSVKLVYTFEPGKVTIMATKAT